MGAIALIRPPPPTQHFFGGPLCEQTEIDRDMTISDFVDHLFKALKMEISLLELEEKLDRGLMANSTNEKAEFSNAI